MESTTDMETPLSTSPLYEAITQNIRVTVLPRFIPENSNAEISQYFYVYTVTMTNESQSTVQLQKRRWEICNALGEVETVEGDGVIGEKPILSPGESYSYTSSCPLDTPTGSMKGSYIFKDPEGNMLDVEIPEFYLRDKSLLN